jgi:hypothetical protein
VLGDISNDDRRTAVHDQEGRFGDGMPAWRDTEARKVSSRSMFAHSPTIEQPHLYIPN